MKAKQTVSIVLLATLLVSGVVANKRFKAFHKQEALKAEPISLAATNSTYGLDTHIFSYVSQLRCRWETIYDGVWGVWKPAVTWDYTNIVQNIDIRYERHCGNCDDTAMNGIRVSLKDYNSDKIRTVTVWNGDWGTWGNYLTNLNTDLNGESFNLVGLQMRFEDSVGPNRDNTAANGLMATYRRYRDVSKDEAIFRGNWGTWKNNVLGSTWERICGLQVRFEDHIRGDNTGLNGLRAYFCEYH